MYCNQNICCFLLEKLGMWFFQSIFVLENEASSPVIVGVDYYYTPTAKFCQEHHKVVHACGLSNTPSISGNQTLWAWIVTAYCCQCESLQYLCSVGQVGFFFFIIINDNFFIICSFSSTGATLSLLMSVIFSSIFYEQLYLIFPVAKGLNFCVSQTWKEIQTLPFPSSSNLVPELHLWQEDYTYRQWTFLKYSRILLSGKDCFQFLYIFQW